MFRIALSTRASLAQVLHPLVVILLLRRFNSTSLYRMNDQGLAVSYIFNKYIVFLVGSLFTPSPATPSTEMCRIERQGFISTHRINHTIEAKLLLSYYASLMFQWSFSGFHIGFGDLEHYPTAFVNWYIILIFGGILTLVVYWYHCRLYHTMYTLSHNTSFRSL